MGINSLLDKLGRYIILSTKCKVFSMKFNTISANFTHQLLTRLKIFDSREGLITTFNITIEIMLTI